MNNKKIGITIVVLSLIIGGFLFSNINNLEAQSQVEECNPNQHCQQVASTLGFSHFMIGGMSALFALGIYMIFFNASESAILARLEAEKQKTLAEERLAILLQALDENEKKIVRAIVDQDGITQSTLRMRTGLSKAKISQVLTSFEKKGLVIRKTKGKTYSVHLSQVI